MATSMIYLPRPVIETSFLCLMLVVLAACGASPGTPLATVARPEASTQAAIPTSLDGVLRNLKYAIDNDLLLQEDFYGMGSLERFFGAAKVTWRKQPKPGVRSGYLSQFGNMVPPLLLPDSQVEGITVAFDFDADPSSRTTALWSFAVVPTSVGFAGVESIFGRNWKNAPPPLPSVHARSNPKTHERGNAHIVYQGKARDSTYRIEFKFFPDATLLSIDVAVAKGVRT